MQLDRTDLRLLSELQLDGRRTITELSEAVGLSQTPCTRRLRALEDAGIIQGYTAVVDPARLGLHVSAYVQIKLDRHNDEDVEVFTRAVTALDHVMSCHALTGSYDFMLHVVAPDLEALSTLVLKRLLAIRGVRDVHSSIVLQTVKQSARVPLDHLA